MIEIAVCDDIEAQRKIIADALIEYFPEGMDLRQFPDGSSLKEAIERDGFRPELAFMDIMLEKQNGINVAEALHRLCPNCAVIFVSSYLDCALDVYRTEHSYFILKSQLRERLGQAIKTALEDKQRSKPSLSYRKSGDYIKIPLDEVIYLERNLKKTIIYLSSGEKRECREKPAELLKNPNKNSFVQCHQSFFVNLDYVTKMSSSDFLLSNGSTVPISRRLQAQAREAFFNSISRLPD